MSHQIKLPKIVQSYNVKNINNLIDNKSDQADVVNAINSGYLIFPSAQFIFQYYQDQSDFEENNEQILGTVKRRRSSKSLPDTESEITAEFYLPFITYLKLSSVPIIEIGDIGFCRNLNILNLSNNHLKQIEALRECVKLFRLDLQDNQIVHLPDEKFWLSMENLKLLFLHNNSIGKLDYLKCLSRCPGLEILTLYDTPMSLRKNYRHHVVNAITTLKALDYYVVSDEEIIEEAIYKPYSRFKAYSDNFYIDLSIEESSNDCYDTAMRNTLKLIKKMNIIIANNSPVHILQKYTRGFIVRNHYKYILQAKNIAKFNESMNVKVEDDSSLMDQSEEVIRATRWWKKKSANTPRTEVTDTRVFPAYKLVDSFIDDSHEDYREPSPDQPVKKRNIVIDLGKLNKLSYTNYPPSRQSNRDTYYKSINESDVERLISFSRLVKLINNFNGRSLDPSYNDEIGKLVKKFSKQLSLTDMNKIGEVTDFRLPMLVPENSILKLKDKYIVDLVKEKHDGCQAIKDMQFECHKRVNDQREEVKVINNEKPMTNDQRFFQKAFGNMSLGCLRAIDKAYADRNLVDAKHNRKLKVEKLKEQNKYSLQRVEYYKEDKIKEAQVAINLENEKKSTYDLKSEEEFEKLKKNFNEQRNKKSQMNKNRRKDVNLAVEFSKQHLSVSKALQKHEYLTHRETKSKENSDLINKLKTNKEAQRELVSKYMQQRNVLRLIQSNNDRVIINNRLREDLEEDQRNAKIRVEYLRYLEYNRRARVVLKRPKDENPTNVLNVGDTLNTDDDDAQSSAILNEVHTTPTRDPSFYIRLTTVKEVD